VIVSFAKIGGIVDHHGFSLHFINTFVSPYLDLLPCFGLVNVQLNP